MAASANGWRVITRDECTDVEVPGGELPIHPEFAWLAQDCAILWHETVEPLLWPGCWGWAKATESGRDPSRFVTNHASGTAWDLSAPKHPRGVPIARHFTPAQLEAISRLEARYFGVLRWGGRWTGKDVDGMHWEGAPGVTVEDARALTAQLSGQVTPPPPPAPAPAPPVLAGPGWTGPDLRGRTLDLRGEHGNNGPRVAVLQRFWRDRYPLYAKDLAVDGWWGDRTSAVCREFAVRSGIPARDVDGRNIGPKIARKLHLAGFRG
jgi:hypothetical protein